MRRFLMLCLFAILPVSAAYAGQTFYYTVNNCSDSYVTVAQGKNENIKYTELSTQLIAPHESYSWQTTSFFFSREQINAVLMTIAKKPGDDPIHQYSFVGHWVHGASDAVDFDYPHVDDIKLSSKSGWFGANNIVTIDVL